MPEGTEMLEGNCVGAGTCSSAQLRVLASPFQLSTVRGHFVCTLTRPYCKTYWSRDFFAFKNGFLMLLGEVTKCLLPALLMPE